MRDQQCHESAGPADARAFELTLDLAIDAARHGRGIIPLDPSTLRPLTAWADVDGTADAATVAEYMRDGLGLGAIGGGRLIALDLEDPSKKGTDGRATLARLATTLGELPRTRETRTKHGGAHLLFSVAHPVSAAVERMRGLDVHASGVDVVVGLLRLPGTPGYSVACDAPIAALPPAWVRAVGEPPRVPALAANARPRGCALRTSRAARLFALERLREVGNDVASLGAGRSEALNAGAFRLAKFRELADDEIAEVLMEAATANGSVGKRGRRECERTIRRGLLAGRRKAAA